MYALVILNTHFVLIRLRGLSVFWIFMLDVRTFKLPCVVAVYGHF